MRDDSFTRMDHEAQMREAEAIADVIVWTGLMIRRCFRAGAVLLRRSWSRLHARPALKSIHDGRLRRPL